MRLLSGNLLKAGLLNLILFTGIFYLLQNESVYQNTLGQISSNYIRLKVDGVTEIQQIKKPYVSISNGRLQNWDADIYYCIKEKLYVKDDGCYSEVRGAFFPLFPLLWKVSQLNSIGISILNYFLFILSLAILVQLLYKGGAKEKLLIYALLVVLPGTVIFYIPYTESLFLFTMTLAFAGHSQNNYRLYFIAVFGMAMLRPATLFILLAIFTVDSLCFLSHRNLSFAVRNFLKKSIPFFLGLVVAILIQYASSGSFTTMIDAQKYWAGSIGLFHHISDWSKEGFGMNAFSVFFIAIPSLAFVIYSILKRKIFSRYYSETIQRNENADSYFFLISIFYLAGILIFIFLTAGGNLHSFFRFTMSSPAFYIVALFTLNHLPVANKRLGSILFIIPLILLTVFLTQTGYGDGRFTFSFVGMHLSIITFMFLYFYNHLKRSVQWVLASILILLCVIWNTYLFNIFLCEGWIFT
ncbi:MAG: hypothetical protein EYC69_01515 [Bacteroidetes bacterium]|nr:MAG: hypothetical protein EYC69_01515 [Bacteroidota bacterium]